MTDRHDFPHHLPRQTSASTPEWLAASLDALHRESTVVVEARRQFATPYELARAIQPDTIQTPALELIDQALVDVDAGRCDRLIITMPPQEGKSTRVTKTGPLFFLLRNPERRIAVVSFGQDLADEFGRDIRGYITDHQGDEDTLDLGLRIAKDNGAVSRWRLHGHRGGVRSVGLRGSIVGRPVDMLFIDDPIANAEQADSPVFREMAWRFWQTTGSARLAPGAPVILILTRWHQDDLAGRLLAAPDGKRWRVLNIPAQADHDPAKGETDVLGREPGEYMISARINEFTGKPRSAAEWEQRKVEAGARGWAALFQGRPSPEAGGVLRAEWWQQYDTPLWIERPDGTRYLHESPSDLVEVTQSWDMTFKDTKGSDYVVGQIWLRRGPNAYLLDQVRGRWSFAETCQQLIALSAKWPQATAKLVEDKANGPAVMNALRSQIFGLIPVEPEGSKYARASAVSPLVQGGNVWLPKHAPWVGDFIEECKSFPNAAHDDQVDAMSQALHRLLLVPILSDQLVTSDDMLEADLEYDAASLTPY